MRTVIKQVIRSVSASDSAALSLIRRESHLKVDHNQNRSRNEFRSSEILNSIPIHNKSSSNDVLRKNNSLSPSYKLSFAEESSFEELLDRECDYYPDNSRRGDMRVLNLKSECSSVLLEKNVNSENVMVSLKNIRFINSIVFNESPIVFLISANYIHRLLHTKAVKKDLMPFIAAAVYDLALEYKTRKTLTNDHRTCLLSVSRIPLNHVEDFSRIKQLLLTHLNEDLEFIVITDYLQILLKIDIDIDPFNHTGPGITFGTGTSGGVGKTRIYIGFGNTKGNGTGLGGGILGNGMHGVGVGGGSSCYLPESHVQLLDIACVLATSCELTHFTLACQALSLVNLAARHVSFSKSFLLQFSDIITKFPIIFLSPVRLNRFAAVANVDEYVIQQCAESIVRYYSKYYASSSPKHNSSSMFSLRRKCSSAPQYGKYSLDNQIFHTLSTVAEEVPKQPEHMMKTTIMGTIKKQQQQKLNIDELIEKLNKVSLAALNSRLDGRQKKRHKRIKRNLSRQLKKYRRNNEEMTNLMSSTINYRSLIAVDDNGDERAKDEMEEEQEQEDEEKEEEEDYDERDSAISSSSNFTSSSNSPRNF